MAGSGSRPRLAEIPASPARSLPRAALPWRREPIGLSPAFKIALTSALAPLLYAGLWIQIRIAVSVRRLPSGLPPSPALAFLFFSSALLTVLVTVILFQLWRRRAP